MPGVSIEGHCEVNWHITNEYSQQDKHDVEHTSEDTPIILADSDQFLHDLSRKREYRPDFASVDEHTVNNDRKPCDTLAYVYSKPFPQLFERNLG